MDWDFLLAWQNIVFLIPLGVSAVLMVLSIAGLGLGAITEGITEGLSAGASEGVAEGISEGASEGAAEGVSHGILGAALGFFYAGRVSLSVTLFTFAMSFATLGVGSNWHFATRDVSVGAGLGAVDTTLVLVSLSIALAGALVLTKAATALLSRYLPMSESYAVNKADLVGCKGVVDSAEVTGEKGRALVASKHGSQITVEVRLAGGEPVRHGTAVLLTGYDAETDLYTVSADSPHSGTPAVS